MALVDPLVGGLVGGLLILAGLVLAFFGAGLVRVFMAVLGAVIGAAFGFLGGSLLGGPIFPFIFLIVGLLIGIFLFGFVVRAAVAFVAGVMAGSVTYLLLAGPTDPGAAIPAGTFVFAFVAFLVGAVLVYLFFNRLMGVITALVGGVLVGVSLNFMAVSLGGLATDIAFAIGIVGGGIIFLAGAIRQAKAG
jgi:hypothetical protein